MHLNSFWDWFPSFPRLFLTLIVMVWRGIWCRSRCMIGTGCRHWIGGWVAGRGRCSGRSRGRGVRLEFASWGRDIGTVVGALAWRGNWTTHRVERLIGSIYCKESSYYYLFESWAEVIIDNLRALGPLLMRRWTPVVVDKLAAAITAGALGMMVLLLGGYVPPLVMSSNLNCMDKEPFTNCSMQLWR